MSGTSCIVDQFRHFCDLNASEAQLLQQLELDPQTYPAGTVLCEAGSEATHLFTLVDGWAGIVRHFADGRRQVLDLYLPGQIMRLRELGSDQARSDLVTFTDVTACPFPRTRISEVLNASPRLAEALLLMLTAEQAMLTERIITISRRPAIERLAHFVLELRVRLGADAKAFPMPLTQELIGDLLGLSSVHVSRTFGRLRKTGLIKVADNNIEITNRVELEALCGFCHQYLRRSDAIC